MPLSAARTALNIGAALTLSLLVILGIYEFSSDHVGSGILVSVIIESLLALGYLVLLFNDRKR